MEQKTDIYRTMLNLAATTQDGLTHIYQRTMDGYFEDTAELFTDVADSIHEMHRALMAYLPDYSGSELEKNTDKIIEGMHLMLAAYEGDQDIRPMVVLQFSLVPGFKKWHEALQEDLGQLCAPALN